jgi:hypothetical protein
MGADMGEFADKAKTVGVSLKKGQKRKKTVTDENTGQTAGYEVEHWDDHQDAVVQPSTVEVKVEVKDLKEE